MVDQNRLVYDDEDGFLASLPPELRPLAPQFGALPPLSHNDYFALCNTLMRDQHDADGHTVHIQVSPVGGQWCSDELIRRCVDWARSHHTRVQMHLLETRYQRHYAHRRWNTSFVQHLDAIGALGPWLSCAHMVWVEREDLPLLAERGVAVAHNPSSNLRLRSGVAPLAAMLDAGVTVGVGLDGHGLDDDQDYLRELRLAWTLAQQPGVGASAPTIDAATIWRLGTRGGAAATLGPDAPLGRLAPGMLADLILIDVEQLVYDPLLAPQQLIEAALRLASRQQVRDVMVHGRWVVRGGRALLLDEANVLQAVRGDLRRAKRVPQAGAAAQALAPYIRRFYAHWDNR
jgi:5-methylthioadenosine/S-adenosylhomocysteine deaminase